MWLQLPKQGSGSHNSPFLFYLSLNVCWSLCIYVHMEAATLRVQKKALGALELGFQVVVSCLTRLLGTELGFSEEL